MKDGEIVQLGTPEQILTEPANEYVERFVEDVDYAKVRHAESVMVHPKEVAYTTRAHGGPAAHEAGWPLSHIFVVDEERRLVGVAEAEEIARLVERDEREPARGGGRPERHRGEPAARGPAALRGGQHRWPSSGKVTASRASSSAARSSPG